MKELCIKLHRRNLKCRHEIEGRNPQRGLRSVRLSGEINTETYLMIFKKASLEQNVKPLSNVPLVPLEKRHNKGTLHSISPCLTRTSIEQRRGGCELNRVKGCNNSLQAEQTSGTSQAAVVQPLLKKKDGRKHDHSVQVL